MPIIFLSPSTQEWNSYVTGSGSEEYNMNLLADAMEPYLLSNGIQCIFFKNKFNMIHFEKFLILFHQCILWLNKNAN